MDKLCVWTNFVNSQTGKNNYLQNIDATIGELKPTQKVTFFEQKYDFIKNYPSWFQDKFKFAKLNQYIFPGFFLNTKINSLLSFLHSRTKVFHIKTYAVNLI